MPSESPLRTAPMRNAHVRVARPTDNLPELIHFYCDGLGLEKLAEFQDHAGFDGLMLGYASLGLHYHLEFTTQRGHPVGRAPTRENLLVFYLPDVAEWTQAIKRMTAHGYAPVVSANPYWDVRGKTFEDPDGYRVVLQQAAWVA